MLSIRSQFAIVLALGALLWLPAGSHAQDVRVQQPTATTAPSPLPAALAEVPVGEVAVKYENGELTIKARNAQLSDILRKVCDKTGAVLDAVADETVVFADLGPGPVRDVLGTLLNDTTFNYAMLGSTGDPNGLARVVVFPRSKNGNEEGQVNQQPLTSTLTASNVQKPPQQQQGTKDTDSVGTAKDANVAAVKQIEALVMAAAAGETVDDTALLQAAAQLGSDASSSAPSSPGVDPSGPPPPGRPRHRRR